MERKRVTRQKVERVEVKRLPDGRRAVAAKPPERKPVDWDAIRADYEADREALRGSEGPVAVNLSLVGGRPARPTCDVRRPRAAAR